MIRVALLFALILTVFDLSCQTINHSNNSEQCPQYLLASNITDYPPWVKTASDSARDKILPYSYEQSFKAARQNVREQKYSPSWLTGGFVAGLTFNLLGTLFVTAIAGPAKPHHIKDRYDQQGYLDGYRKQSKIQNKNSALVGGVLGSATQVLIISLIAGSLDFSSTSITSAGR